MPNHLQTFWNQFNQKKFSDAADDFVQLDETEQQSVLAELFQKSQYHRKPEMVSLLRRVLHDDKNFDDFHQAWLPDEKQCNKITANGQVFQQFLPAPTRVINAINPNNPKEIFSISFTWVENEEERQALWQYVQKLSAGNDQDNQARHDEISRVADTELLGIAKVETDDNLGTPF